MRHPLRAWSWSFLLGGGLGCVAAPFGRLDGILVDAQPDPRLATPGELGRVQVTREGNSQPGSPNMSLMKGDTLVTAADGIGVLQLAAGYEIILDPGTDITIENPSIFVRIGRVIIKKIGQIREALTVKTEIGAAAVEGTQLVVEVTRRGEVDILVLEGRVKVYPLGTSRWRDTAYYVAGERATLNAGRISRLSLDDNTVRFFRRRITEIEHEVRPVVPNVIGMTEAEARAELGRHNFRVSVSPVMTRRGRVGTVVATSPTGGTLRRQGDLVRLEVEAPSTLVPNLLGQSFGVAVRLLSQAGLRLGDTSSVVSADAVDGTVIGMAPSQGAPVALNSAVSLRIARRPVRQVPDVRVVRPRGCEVPSLINRTEEQARKVLLDGGWRVGRIQRLESGRTITAQDPKPGTMTSCGATVSFTVGTIGD